MFQNIGIKCPTGQINSEGVAFGNIYLWNIYNIEPGWKKKVTGGTRNWSSGHHIPTFNIYFKSPFDKCKRVNISMCGFMNT